MLWKKMLRDLKEHRGAYTACAAIILVGLMAFTSLSLMLEYLKVSQESFYAEQNFAHGFARVKELPFGAEKRLQETEGIDRLQGRYVSDVRALLPGREGNIYLRLIFVEPEEKNRLNDMLLLKGRPLEEAPFKGFQVGILLDNQFFDANGLHLNDTLEVIVDGRTRELHITGVGTSPEYIYALRTAADMYPSPETFGIAFVPLPALATLYPGAKGFNDLVFTLEELADFDHIKPILEYQLMPYGLLALFPREEQPSHLILSEEIKGLEAVSSVMPMLFLLIAAVILYIVLQRTIEQQRGQIGILKALGYTDKEVLWHYLLQGLLVSLAGGVGGTLLGLALSIPLAELYRQFFNMPLLIGRFSAASYFIRGILLAAAFSLTAGYLGARKLLFLKPAVAMRPPAPPRGKKVWLEKAPFFWNILTVQGMMAVRNIWRNRGRSLFIFTGITLCFALCCFTWSMNDLIQKMLFDQYEKVETYDLKITLVAPSQKNRVLRELGAFPGVLHAEALAEVPVKLKNKWLEKEVQLLGITQNSQLYHILNKKGQKVPPPAEGLLLSERLAELLEAEVGTMLNVSSLLHSGVGAARVRGESRGQDEKLLPVVGVVPQYLGVNAYMELTALQDFLGEEELATSFLLLAEEDAISALKEKYRQSNLIGSMDERSERIDKLNELMASYGSMIYIYALIGMILGFAIIYISSVITTSERSRELALMMVLGMTPAEVLSVVTFEQWFISVLGIAAGIPTASLFMSGISAAMSSDVFTIPPVITAPSYLAAAGVTIFSIWVAQKFAGSKIRRLTLVEILKAAE